MRFGIFPRNAPRFLGAFLLPALLTLSGCEKKSSTPPWEGQTVAVETEAKEAEVQGADPKKEDGARAASPKETTTGSLRFVAYNLKNWLTMDRYVDRKPVGSTPKPEDERQAIIEILKEAQPDILGVCEIGTKDDLADLQNDLRNVGIDLPHRFHSGGVDDTRRLALLSRFPITASRVPKDLTYKLGDRERGMSRGILDATVDSPAGELRFLGVHLKSKREIPDGDQEMMRRAEAHLLRREADRILSDQPDTQLIVYGDMNDTRQASALRTIQGPRNGPTSLKMAYLRDSRGESWTHFWSYQDVYSRFDYILMSPPLVSKIAWDDCRVLDSESWSDASDHRALLLVIE
ncbi:endonuclease/exonuclease/phosphatase family protein [Haloferula chungangensis]|uniref:Endonuclease/exonuclease/phosphatase family protein n=1 Tax=Haloferula chungangensis TaxID=1048331 RepID=A0ABW2L017_9BACT